MSRIRTMNQIKNPSVSDICDEFGNGVRDVVLEPGPLPDPTEERIPDYADLPVTPADKVAWRLQWENRYSRTPAETSV